MAGQSRQALRTRIKSVKSTRKITKAMEMIANAKLFRQRSKMESNREYAQRLQDTVDEIVYKNPDAESCYLTEDNE
jgi:F-type H+-transporting ATPase subunit gamma